MKKYLISLMALLLVLLTGCSKADVTDLKVYVIERSKLTASLTASEAVAAAKTSGRFVFDGNDIDGYNWETHTVTLKKESVPSLGTLTSENGGSAIFKVDDTYAFVLTINDKLIYSGGFIQGSKNPSVPLQPYISDIDRYSFAIRFDSKYATAADNRSSATLYSFLNKFGLLSSNTI